MKIDSEYDVFRVLREKITSVIHVMANGQHGGTVVSTVAAQ